VAGYKHFKFYLNTEKGRAGGKEKEKKKLISVSQAAMHQNNTLLSDIKLLVHQHYNATMLTNILPGHAICQH
jgi:hypothetical protein